jgi:hypothetical protein
VRAGLVSTERAADEEVLMPRALLVRSRIFGALVAIGLGSLGACADAPGTGARIQVVNGPGASPPQYLLFDWADSAQVLVHDRRVPGSGALDPAANPLALIQIASSDATDPVRTMRVQGMVGEQPVSRGEGSVQLVAGSWQQTTIVLASIDATAADAGVPADGDVDAAPVTDLAPLDDAAEPDAAADLPPPPDLAVADTGVGPVDARAVDAAVVPPRPDSAADVAVDGPAVVVAIVASADSFVEQGQTASTQNHGTATTLEVKSQAGQDNDRIAFFRFSLTAVSGLPITTATLRVYGRSAVGQHMDSVYGVTDESWTEGGITWNNKPALGAKLSTLSIGTTGQYREYPVTAFVKAQLVAGRASVNLALGMDNDTDSSPDTWNSREAASNQPQLVLAR